MSTPRFRFLFLAPVLAFGAPPDGTFQDTVQPMLGEELLRLP